MAKSAIQFSRDFCFAFRNIFNACSARTSATNFTFQERNIDILKSKHFGTAGYIISNGAAKYLINLFEKLAVEEIRAIDEIMFNEQINVSLYQVYQLNPAICVQELQLNQENSLLVSDLQQERKKYSSAHQENIKTAFNSDKRKYYTALNKENGKNNNV